MKRYLFWIFCLSAIAMTKMGDGVEKLDARFTFLRPLLWRMRQRDFQNLGSVTAVVECQSDPPLLTARIQNVANGSHDEAAWKWIRYWIRNATLKRTVSNNDFKVHCFQAKCSSVYNFSLLWWVRWPHKHFIIVTTYYVYVREPIYIYCFKCIGISYNLLFRYLI